MEALSREFRIGSPWELLYANDLVTVAKSLDELKMRLKNWKEGLEVKGLKVNVGNKGHVLQTRCSQYQDHICQIPT